MLSTSILLKTKIDPKEVGTMRIVINRRQKFVDPKSGALSYADVLALTTNINTDEPHEITYKMSGRGKQQTLSEGKDTKDVNDTVFTVVSVPRVPKQVEVTKSAPKQQKRSSKKKGKRSAD